MTLTPFIRTECLVTRMLCAVLVVGLVSPAYAFALVPPYSPVASTSFCLLHACMSIYGFTF